MAGEAGSKEGILHLEGGGAFGRRSYDECYQRASDIKNGNYGSKPFSNNKIEKIQIVFLKSAGWSGIFEVDLHAFLTKADSSALSHLCKMQLICAELQTSLR